MIELIEAVPSMTGRLKTWFWGLLAAVFLGLCLYGQVQFGSYMYSMGAKSKQQELNEQTRVQLEEKAAQITELGLQLKAAQASYVNLSSTLELANAARQEAKDLLDAHAGTINRLVGLRESERKDFERKLAGVSNPETLKRAISGYEDNFERCLKHTDRFASEAANYSGQLAKERATTQALTGYIGERQAFSEQRKNLKTQPKGTEP